MTMHFSSQEFVSALDHALTPARQAHLDACPSCQAQVAELRTLAESAALDAEVPEPSPLFWDHFQTRVLTAVQSEEPPRSSAWWRSRVDARTLVAAVATVVAVAASVALYVSRQTALPETLADGGTGPGSVMESGSMTMATTPLDNEEWEFVASVMGTLDDEGMHEVLAPSRDAVDAAIEALTSDERDRFVKLLKDGAGE
jgi:hypothetical protein